MYGRKWSVVGGRSSLWLKKEFRRDLENELIMYLERQWPTVEFGYSVHMLPNSKGFHMVIMTSVELDLHNFVTGYIVTRFKAHNIRVVHCKSRRL